VRASFGNPKEEQLLKVEDMTADEMQALLLSVGFGHLGCTRDGHPYVVPMHYAYDGQDLYFFTTEGTKTEFIAANHEVCFQVEEIVDSTRWRSVMFIGEAHKISKPEEAEHAMQLITENNPTLTPAINKTDIGAWHRLNKIAIYRVRASALYGRRTV
jgi:nitroimidazol reductase NimA-like FMN-containing flavoprotein (pyridoxamine 5'-phosphate oxidase superfamily)